METETIDRTPAIKTLQEVLKLSLAVPEYQRPYKWQAATHVRQLLEDVIREADYNREYRIGTLILHVENSKSNPACIYNIVDGQQRLITLSLLLLVLGFGGENNLLGQAFRHSISKDNIKYNYQFIEDFIQRTIPDKREKLRSYVVTKCSFAVLPVEALSEAFQLFDSQNARGKKLDPADLLKAYHLREMHKNTEAEKRICVKNWEKAVENDVLNTIVGSQLFRLRNWSDKNLVYFFSAKDISTFKGLNILRTLQNEKNYPYLRIVQATEYSTAFSITERLINGKRFFDYVQHYVSLAADINSYINSKRNSLVFDYPGSNRNSGDQKLKNLYKNLLLFYADRFGIDDHDFVSFSKEAYRWVYQKRLIHPRISEKTILKELEPDNIISRVNKWYCPDIPSLRLSIPLLSTTNIKKEVSQIIDCIKKIENNG